MLKHVELPVLFRFNLLGEEGEKKSCYSLHWLGYVLVVYWLGFFILEDE